MTGASLACHQSSRPPSTVVSETPYTHPTATALASDAWERSVRIQWPHETEGPISVGSIIEMQANHAAQRLLPLRTEMKGEKHEYVMEN